MNSHKTMDMHNLRKKNMRYNHAHVQLLAYQHELTLNCMKSLNIEQFTQNTKKLTSTRGDNLMFKWFLLSGNRLRFCPIKQESLHYKSP